MVNDGEKKTSLANHLLLWDFSDKQKVQKTRFIVFMMYKIVKNDSKTPITFLRRP